MLQGKRDHSRRFYSFDPDKADLVLDMLMSNITRYSLSWSVEEVIRHHFSADRTFYFENISDQNVLYSKAHGITIPYPINNINNFSSSGIVNFVFSTQKTVILGKAAEHFSYQIFTDNKFCVPDRPIILFPLFDSDDNVIGVVVIVFEENYNELSQKNDIESSENENEIKKFVKWFQVKFKALTGLIHNLNKGNDETFSLINEIYNTENLVEFNNTVIIKICTYLKVDYFGIWIKNSNDHIERVSHVKKDYTKDNDADKVNDTFYNKDEINDKSNDKENNNEENDEYSFVERSFEDNKMILNSQEDIGRSILVYPRQVSDKAIQAIKAVSFVIKYKTIANNNQFDQNVDISRLSKIAASVSSFLIRCSKNNDDNNVDKTININGKDLLKYNVEEFQNKNKKFEELLKLAQNLSKKLDMLSIINVVLEQSRILIDADRCSLFLLNEEHTKLYTYYQSGLDRSIKIPFEKGIVGQALQQKKTLNIPDANECSFFDPTLDEQTGYKTVQVLSVPIFNEKQEVIGVTQMLNKKEDKLPKGSTSFTQMDEKLVEMFNIFLGIAVENTRLYDKSNHLAQDMQMICRVSFSLMQSHHINCVLSEIIKNTLENIGAECASLFLVDKKEQTLSTFIVIGGFVPATIPLGSGIAALCVKENKAYFNNDVYSDPKFNKTYDLQTGFKTNSLLVAPLAFSKNRNAHKNKVGIDGSDRVGNANSNVECKSEAIGVLELVNKKDKNGFTDNDLNLVKLIATFASLALEKAEMNEIIKYGDAEVELAKLVKKNERKVYDRPPKKLGFSDPNSFSPYLNFYSIDFQGIGHLKLIFNLFYKYQIPIVYKIPNELLFRFIFAVRQTYNDVPYHNWSHACDVLEYVSYEIETAKLADKLTTFEIFSLFVASLCHDANHKGFNNIYNLKAHTPLGLLFQDQSVMETFHLTVAIQILQKDDNNIFYSLNEEELTKMWNFVITLVLATDMAKHKELIDGVNQIQENENEHFSMDNPDHRLLAMKLLLKCGDVSNGSRPFDVAKKWCDVLSEEFYRQGDLEKKIGIGYTSPLNDRYTNNVPKSQIFFYTNILLPLFSATALILPELEINVESIKKNIEIWGKLANLQ